MGGGCATRGEQAGERRFSGGFGFVRDYALALEVDRERLLPLILLGRRADLAARGTVTFFAVLFFFPLEARAFLTSAAPTADAAAAPTTAATIPAARDVLSD